MKWKTFGLTAATAAGLALGVVVGPALSGTASAQTQPQAQTATAVPTKPAQSNDTLRSLFLDKLAAELNIQRSALDSALAKASTSTLDAAVQQGTLTQIQADALKARIAAGDTGALWGGRGGIGPGGAGVGGPGKHAAGVGQAVFDAAAQALGITTSELQTQLRSGQTLAQIAQSKNTTEQAVVNAALAAAKTQLDAAVKAGTLTQPQADAQYAQLQQQGAALLTVRGRGGEGPRGGRGAPTTPQSPTPAPTGA